MRDIRIVLVDNNNPLDELFDKLITYSAPVRSLGQIDLLKANLTIDVGNLNTKATKIIMTALWKGVQWNWNLGSGHVSAGNSAFLILRVVKPNVDSKK